MTRVGWSWEHCQEHGSPSWLCPVGCEADLTEHDAAAEGTCVVEHGHAPSFSDPGEPSYEAIEDARVTWGGWECDLDELDMPAREREHIEYALWERRSEESAEAREEARERDADMRRDEGMVR
jgi:hypothetical protein